ncbi:MAG: amidohydrolase family protein, partial [Gammaproteobacteria bacterium]|nr:amidohydrolase family protein [Gammaproteobacteria bacterium]
TELARIANDAMAEMVQKHPDRFPAFVASVAMHDMDGALAEIDRAVNDLGAKGVQVFTNVAGRPLDDPKFDPLFKKMWEYGLPVWMSVGTAREAERRAGLLDTVRLICDQQRFSIGDIEINPYPVPHDATEPLQFTFSDGAHSVGLLTDAGEVTPHIESQLRRCDALLLECNHDLELLQSGPYPYALKRRVAGRLGHLNNRQAAELLERVDTTQLQHLVVMHLSERNNCKTKALAAVSDVLGCDPEWVTLADQQEGFGWREVA